MHTAIFDFERTATRLVHAAMNLQDEDIGAGIFLWSMISFFTMGLTAIGGWALWG
jgi:hypothetical protein